MCVEICIYIYTYICTHTYTRVYVCMYVCTCIFPMFCVWRGPQPRPALPSAHCVSKKGFLRIRKHAPAGD